MPTIQFTFRADGTDQKGVMVGLPQKGDIAKCHIKGDFWAVRKGVFGKPKSKKIDFLDTHTVGDTAFLELNIGTKYKDAPIRNLLIECVSQMPLGSTVLIDIDPKTFEVPDITADGKLCRGQYGALGKDADRIVFEVDLFRIARKGTEHHRKRRNRTSNHGGMVSGF
eukprot:CAMPEP_0194028760 /NCGR_PEP_ID=MMETSP0009_2-20130614/2662_1 /TAXON_ID=210454 /ORGANISM="Grammatophora oceanica, Strain CCMP 410" /LENGTH=166 /DNA_ID=CAMNT_0038668245 /DNA_START=26 /DNA_END=526 /DNA_ORIENTATION=+